MSAALQTTSPLSTTAVCAALAVPRATLYRRRAALTAAPKEAPGPREIPRRLSEPERTEVLAVLHSERFVDRSPGEVYATLLDEERYLCSERTMYRVLAEQEEVRERRRQRQHPVYTKPELLATGPNQVWSWDITKLRGPVKWSYFHLYVVLDIVSRDVVAWMVASRESATLAKRLLTEAYDHQNVQPGQLVVHADRGTSMTSKTVAQLLADLSVTKTHSRPHVSDDNPFSEAQFKTLKYCPEFPGRFASPEDARAFCRPFFTWYNREHRHGGVGHLTPEDVHHGRAPAVVAARANVLEAAYQAHPERFVRGMPTPEQLPTAVWINPPKPIASASVADPKPENEVVVVGAVGTVSNRTVAEAAVSSPAPSSDRAPCATSAADRGGRADSPALAENTRGRRRPRTQGPETPDRPSQEVGA